MIGGEGQFTSGVVNPKIHNPSLIMRKHQANPT